MTDDDPDEVVLLDPAWLALLAASARSGYLCHECKATVAPADTDRLLSIAETYQRHRDQQEALQSAEDALVPALLAWLAALLGYFEVSRP